VFVADEGDEDESPVGFGGWTGCDGTEGDYVINFPDGSGTDVDLDGTWMTLSLREEDDECQATIAARWYPAARLPARVTRTAVLLRHPDESGEVSELGFEEDALSDMYYDSDALSEVPPVLATGRYSGMTWFYEVYWRSIELPRNAVGALRDPVRGLTIWQWSEDDICGHEWAVEEGSVKPDKQAPSVRSGPATFTPPTRPSGWAGCYNHSAEFLRPGVPREGLLPWDIVAVEASETVPGLESSIRVSGADAPGESTVTPFAPAELTDGATADDTWAWARFADWDRVSGTVQVVTVDEGLADAAGNPLATAQFELMVRDVGPPRSSFEFDGESRATIFGSVSMHADHVSVRGPCDYNEHGVAGRLETADRNRVLFRVRSPENAILIRVYGASGRRYSIEGYEETIWAYEWETAEIPIQDEPEVGFTVTPYGECHFYEGAQVDIDRIWAD
jgi:hypothetical protein